jgi:hypothetical protein
MQDPVAGAFISVWLIRNEPHFDPDQTYSWRLSLGQLSSVIEETDFGLDSIAVSSLPSAPLCFDIQTT